WATERYPTEYWESTNMPTNKENRFAAETASDKPPAGQIVLQVSLLPYVIRNRPPHPILADEAIK
ncbi:hypothetical protein, partial [Bacteroides heparinolyticus]|uniref:hypothetical protein n=1 Tax=Prevotella heparinolytica TaxID=28113 RepID=UPI0035A05324